MPIVSVIVPFFNVGSLLQDCLTSIAESTLSDFECILIDDGSSDESAAIARRWTQEDERFRLLEQENRGPGPARNLGIAHASGEYLMFVDGDDLLAPRALEQLHASLTESGSDFAGAQVWRLPLTRPIEPSWAHREPFAERRQRTHITEIPLLMRDRMVWNKMWRRSFWDEQGYEWPDMLFEDFPVILAAHLDATAVDTLPDPVYVWRERPKGESISVRGAMVNNVRDRVIAAKMVIDIVDAKGTPELRELVHSHLVDVDLREVMASLLAVEEAGRDAVEALAHQLGQDLDPAYIALAQPDLQQAMRAARANDMTTLRAMAEQRTQTTSTSSSVKTRVRKAPTAVARRAKAAGSKVNPHRPRTGKLVDYRIEPGNLTYRVQIPLSARLKQHVSVKATIGQQEMATEFAVTPTGLLCDFSIDATDVAGHDGFQPLHFDVAVRGGLHFAGYVMADVSLLDGVHRAGYWLQGLIKGGRFGIQRTRRASLIESLRFDGAQLVFRLNSSSGTFLVERPWPSHGLETPVTDHEARVDLSQLIMGDPADNPVTGIASRRLKLRTVAGEEDLRLLGPGLRQNVAGRDVEIKRAEDGTAFLVHRPL